MASDSILRGAPNSPRRVLLASPIGTTIEFFDFYIHAAAAVLASYLATWLAVRYGIASVGYYLSAAGLLTLISLLRLGARRFSGHETAPVLG